MQLQSFHIQVSHLYNTHLYYSEIDSTLLSGHFLSVEGIIFVYNRSHVKNNVINNLHDAALLNIQMGSKTSELHFNCENLA